MLELATMITWLNDHLSTHAQIIHIKDRSPPRQNRCPRHESSGAAKTMAHPHFNSSRPSFGMTSCLRVCNTTPIGLSTLFEPAFIIQAHAPSCISRDISYNSVNPELLKR